MSLFFFNAISKYVHSLSEILKNVSPFGVFLSKFEISYYIKIIEISHS